MIGAVDRPGSSALPAGAGQAQIELIASIPIFVVVAAVILQLFAVGYTQSLADGAAEAGAIALASDRSPESAAMSAIPGWARERAEVSAQGGRVLVSVRAPSLIPGAGSWTELSARAWTRPGDGEDGG